MAKPLDAYLIIAVTIVVIVIINIGIIRRAAKNKNSEAKSWSNVINQIRNPWQKEDQDLEELAKLIAQSKLDQSTGRNSEEISQKKKSSKSNQ
jgi:hypothetical protein